MKKLCLILLAFSLSSPLALADETTKAKKKPKKGDDDLSINIIGNQETPLMINVVPWKDREVKVEKKDATSSLLTHVLEPLDRQELQREIQYYKLIQQAQ